MSGADRRAQVVVVIVNYRSAAMTLACLQSLAAEAGRGAGLRAIVVENDSGDETRLAAGIHANGWSGWVDLIAAERNGGFSYGNNLGIARAMRMPHPPDFVLLLNPDTLVRSGAIDALVHFMAGHPRAGIVGSGIENPDGTAWPIAFRFHSAWSQLEQGMRLGIVTRLLRHKVVARVMGSEPARVDWVSGASMMLRTRLIEALGPMDEGYFLYFEEVDYCLRAGRAGWECWYVPEGKVMHVGGEITGVSSRDRRLGRMPDYWFASRTRYFVKNHGLAYARLADLAFGCGLAVDSLRRWLLGRERVDPPGMLADFWRTSVLFMSRSEVQQRIGSGSNG